MHLLEINKLFRDFTLNPCLDYPPNAEVASLFLDTRSQQPNTQ